MSGAPEPGLETCAIMPEDNCDVVIVGAGLAGVAVALSLPETLRVTLLVKDALPVCASQHAQGGIAAVLSPDDSLEQHMEDTLDAGAGLCRPEAVRHIVGLGPESLAWLCDLGVEFSRDEGSHLHLTREGGHSKRRIAHAGDASGRAIMAALNQRLQMRGNIQVREHVLALDVCIAPNGRGVSGLVAYDQQAGRHILLRAPHVVLAAGGLGRLYSRTSNPPGATGDGIAMAWRAGAAVCDLEFIQFHPTCLIQKGAPAFLISEAMRGEGAWLTLANGERFMSRHDPRGELAPRDIVSRAIEHEMQENGLANVYLDISHRGHAFIEKHFPVILERCLGYGIDIRREPIPVAPAAHYSCGGVETDLLGRSNIPGLYAVGESGCTGLHGANRLASNSLLECVAVGRALGAYLGASSRRLAPPAQDAPRAWTPSVGEADPAALRVELLDLMDRTAGLLRRGATLERAAHQIHQWRALLAQGVRKTATLREVHELRNLLDTAALVVRAALGRTASCGLHQRVD
jgi:L-aspartate oxidase